jgi:major membrane immunogen (membrane-anchored lipoprotein)
LSGSFDAVYGTAVNASAAIGASIGVNYADITLLRDSAERTGVVAGATVDAFISNSIGQGIHLLFFKIGSMA